MDIDRAERVIKFIELLRHTKSPFYGQPFNLMPWQKDFIKELYGTVDVQGHRQYRQSLLFLPRKNGKSCLSSALALYHLLADGTPGGEVYTVAGSREQAAIVFNQARDFMRTSPALKEVCHIVDHAKRIINQRTGSVLRALSADAAQAHGLNPTAAILDEVHTWPGQKGRDLYEAMVTGSGTRKEPLVLAITTAGADQNGICWEIYDYACKVRDGIIDDPTFYPCIYEAPQDADWTSPNVWQIANPAAGEFRSTEDLAQMCERAQKQPSLEPSFRRLYLNQWVTAETRWLDMAQWDSCGAPVDIEELRGRPCYAGLDLSTTTDLSALVLVFPTDDDPPAYKVLPFFWIPGERMAEKIRTDRVPYDLWHRQGHIEVTPGNVIDYRAIKAKIKELATMFELKEIAADRWNATQLIVELTEDGANMIPTGMGFASMSSPTKELETLVLSGRIQHGGHPVLRWNVDSVVVETDAAGNIKPSKRKSTQRIDGVVAAILAIDRAMRHKQSGSIYDRQELRFI